MSRLYNAGADAVTGPLRWETASDIRALLVTGAYTPNRDHDTVSDVTTSELSGGNYARLDVSGRTRTRDDANDRIVFDASDLLFPSLEASAGTPGYLIVYDETEATDAARGLIGWVTLQAPKIPDGSDYAITFASAGIWILSTV